MIEEKKLTEFDLNHIIYMSVGTHLGEKLDEIIKRKNDEIENFSMSLWAFESGISKTIYELCNKLYEEHEDLYCVMVDTGKDTETKDGKEAKYYKDISGNIVEIPEGMKVTFAKNGSCALMVEKYYKIVGDNCLNTREYDYEDHTKYIRGFGFLNKKDDSELKNDVREPLNKRVLYVAKLKKPFLVNIFAEKSGDNKAL